MVIKSVDWYKMTLPTRPPLIFSLSSFYFMNVIKKILGLVWIILGPVLISIAVMQANQELGTVKPEKFQETMMFWVIIITIFVPIMAGLSLFGLYALKGEYDSKQ